MTLRITRRRALSMLFDLMTAGFVAVFGVLSGSNQSDGWVMTLFVGGPMALAVLFRRRWPVTVMVAVSIIALGQVVVFGPEAEPVDVAVLIAMYAVVKYGTRLWYAFLAAAVALVGVVIVTIPAYSRLNQFQTIGGVTAAVWLTGYVVRTRRLYVTSLEERARSLERERDQLAKLAAADERAAIARELHDVVAHSLAVMIVQADGATYTLDTDREQARGALDTIAATGRDALEDMRRIVGVLRGGPAGDDDPDRRRIGLDQLDALVERACSAGLRVDKQMTGTVRPLTPAEELTIFRVAQEAMTNVLRHAGAGASVTLSLSFTEGPAGPRVEVEVADDGAGRLAVVGAESGNGSAPAADGQRPAGVPRQRRGSADGAPTNPQTNGPTPPQPGGHGLVGMRERVAVHGGEFDAGPILGGGWRVRAVVPVRGGGHATAVLDGRTVS